MVCSVCKKEKKLSWANKSHKYLRDLSDYVALCWLCHKIYDGQAKLTYLQIEEIKKIYKEKRIKQKMLAEIFGIDQSNISRIINNKSYSI